MTSSFTRSGTISRQAINKLDVHWKSTVLQANSAIHECMLGQYVKHAQKTTGWITGLGDWWMADDWMVWTWTLSTTAMMWTQRWWLEPVNERQCHMIHTPRSHDCHRHDHMTARWGTISFNMYLSNSYRWLLYSLLTTLRVTLHPVCVIESSQGPAVFGQVTWSEELGALNMPHQAWYIVSNDVFIKVPFLLLSRSFGLHIIPGAVPE